MFTRCDFTIDLDVGPLPALESINDLEVEVTEFSVEISGAYHLKVPLPLKTGEVCDSDSVSAKWDKATFTLKMKLPVIRFIATTTESDAPPDKPSDNVGQTESATLVEPVIRSAAAHLYDKGYRKWDLFNVDAALESVEGDVENTGRGFRKSETRETVDFSDPDAETVSTAEVAVEASNTSHNDVIEIPATEILRLCTEEQKVVTLEPEKVAEKKESAQKKPGPMLIETVTIERCDGSGSPSRSLSPSLSSPTRLSSSPTSFPNNGNEQNGEAIASSIEPENEVESKDMLKEGVEFSAESESTGTSTESMAVAEKRPRLVGPMYPRLNTARREIQPNKIIDERDAAKAERRKADGNSAVKRKHYETAIRCYSEAIRLNPIRHIYYSNRSMVHFTMEAWDLAAKDAAICVVLDPTFLKGYIRLAAATQKCHEYTESLTIIEDALELFPEDADLTRLRKVVEASMMGKDTQEAKMFGGRPDAHDFTRLQKETEEREALRNSGPADPRDSGEDMTLYQTPEYYDKHMELLPPEVRTFHLQSAELKMKEAEALRPGSIVLDLCCGTGWGAINYGLAHPGVFFIGIDNSEPMLEVARERATKNGMRNVFFINADAEMLTWNALRIPETISKGRRYFDAVVSVFGLSVVPNWYAALCASWRLLRPGGSYTILDLHFLKGESESQDESVAKKALSSQDHSRRLWEGLEQMPDMDECTTEHHELRRQYYCAAGRKKRFNPVDLENAAFKIEGDDAQGEVIEGVHKWDPELGDVPLRTSKEPIQPAVSTPTVPPKKLRPRGSSESIDAYYKATGGVCY